MQRLQCRAEAGDGLAVAPELTEAEHDQKAGQQKTDTADQSPQESTLKPSQVDRHLTGGGTGQRFTETQAFIEAIGINPATALHDLLPEHGDVGLGATEAKDSDSQVEGDEGDPGAGHADATTFFC